MRLRDIEARIAKIEAARNTNLLARLSEEDLDREIVARMNTLAADYGGDIGAAITALEASPDLLDREAAAGFTSYIEIKRQQREHRGWTARMVARYS